MSPSVPVLRMLVFVAWVHAVGCGRFGVELVPEQTLDEAPSTGVDAAIDVSVDASDVRDAGPMQSEPDQDAGVAAPACEVGFANCDGDVSASCETNLQTTPTHCGSCARSCSYEHAAAACRAGSCTLGACTLGYADCDGNPENGCEVAIDTASNCGACGKTCNASGVTPLCTAEGCGTTCDVTGTWAVLVDFRVSWTAQSVVGAGSGRLRYWQRLELSHARGGVSGTATSCGTELPNSRAALGPGETFGSLHPAALFDVDPPLFAPVPVAMALSGEVPGSTFTLPAFAMTRGIVMNNPLTDMWPTSAYGVTSSIDEDKDGQAGFTVPFKMGEGVVFPALDLLRATRSDQAYAADRFIYGATGSLSSCLRGEGKTDVTTFDARILACHVAGLGPCSPRQRDLLDNNVPEYTPSDGRFSMVRLAPLASCREVRAALP